MRHYSRESRCAVHSSALIDGVTSLHQGSGDAVAAQFSIGMTEPHHRQSGVVQLARHVRGHRQDSVRSVVVDLHQASSAVAELRVQTVALMVFLDPSNLCSGHAWAPSSLRALAFARALTSACEAAGSPQ